MTMAQSLFLWGIAGGVWGWLLLPAADYLLTLSSKASSAAPFHARLRFASSSASMVALPVLWWLFGDSVTFIRSALIFSFLLLIVIIDLRHHLIPNFLTYPAIALFVVVHLIGGTAETLHYLVGGATAFAIFFLTARLRPGSLGGGDIKLATLIGLAYGFPDMLLVFLVGVLAGGVVVIHMLLVQKRALASKIPYAPFLCLGALAGMFFDLSFLLG